MKQTCSDLFDPRAIMCADYSFRTEGNVEDCGDYSFAFNNDVFSDRVLRLEIASGPSESRLDGEACTSLAEWARVRKRRREEEIGKENELLGCQEERILICNQLEAKDIVACKNHDEEVLAMNDESFSGDETVHGNDSLSMDCSALLHVKCIHISSPILAAKSPFFYKLFSNGKQEPHLRQITIRINASVEGSFMELLNFIYSGTISTTTAPALLDLLMTADKFEVASCMRHCCRLLRDMPMTIESALLYLELPSNVRIADAVQPLTIAAKQYLTNHYKDISKFEDEVLRLPSAGMEVILSSDDLQVASEDNLYDLLLKWARVQYPSPEKRREILGPMLGRLIRFPYMTCRKLKKVLTCNDIDHELASKFVIEALFFKSEAPRRQRSLATEETSTSRQFIERAYKYRPVKVVEFEHPHQQCIVYLDLKREECKSLYPNRRVYSQAFYLGGQGFFLSAHCNSVDYQGSFYCFGLFLGMQDKGSASFEVDYEFAARTAVAGEFVSKFKGNYTFIGGKAVGYRNLFSIPWTNFIADDSTCFINGVLHLRAELNMRKH